MPNLIEYHPMTPNREYRRVSLPNHGFAPAALVEAACEELNRLAGLMEAKLHEPTACERLTAWLISGNVLMYAKHHQSPSASEKEAGPC